MGAINVAIMGERDALMARIFIASNSSWNLFNFRNELIRSLVEDGHQLICLCPSDNYDDKLSSLGVKRANVLLSRTNLNPFNNLITLIHYIILFICYRPDYYLAFTIKPNIYGGLASRLFKTKSIHNISGLGYSFIRKSWLTVFVTFLYRLALSKAYHVFFQNDDDKKLFTELMICEPKISTVLPGSGVDTNYFSPVKKIKKGKTFRFLMVSRLLADKGVREFVAAAEALYCKSIPCEFVLVGSLDKTNPSSISDQELNNWIQKGVIKYQGHTDDIKSVYSSANCVVLPSYREGAPRTLIEAGAMGIPAIATDVPGCRQVIRDKETGFLVNVRDVSDLKKKMQEIYHMKPEQFRKMQKMARMHMVNKFCITNIIIAYRQQISKTL